MHVKRATLIDFDWLWEQCEAFSKTYESKLSLTSNVEYAKDFLKNLICNHLVLVTFTDSLERTGFIAGLVQPHHFNPDIRMLSELLWWVPPEHRGGKSGALLLDSFIDYGKDRCHWITFTVERTTPISDKPLLKRGFKHTETAYLMECN